VLKSVSVFAEVIEEILADPDFLDEIEIDEGEPVYEKGVIGRTMYIVADGKVRIHDGDRTFVELGPAEFFGELTTLDGAALSISDCPVDSHLLGLDRDALYSTRQCYGVWFTPSVTACGTREGVELRVTTDCRCRW
jgi:CRP-like cAMP-binding protein